MMTATPTMIQAMTYMGLGFCDMDANSVQPLEDGKWRTVRQRILGAFHSAFASITPKITRLRRTTWQSVNNVPPQLGCILSLCCFCCQEFYPGVAVRTSEKK
jgi:hypothetical protein